MIDLCNCICNITYVISLIERINLKKIDLSSTMNISLLNEKCIIYGSVQNIALNCILNSERFLTGFCISLSMECGFSNDKTSTTHVKHFLAHEK